MRRRIALLLTSILLSGGLAGCVGPQDDDTNVGFNPGTGWDGSPGPGDEPEPPEPGSWDVHVTVNPAAGPYGASAPVQVDRGLYGMNVADWVPEDYWPEANETYVAYLKELEPGVLRLPAGHTSQSRIWDRTQEGHPSWTAYLTPEHVDAFIRLCEEVGAEPLIAVSRKEGTAAQAADLVRYVNVEKGYDVTWWQIGNEPDLGDGLTSGPEEYATDFVAYSQAMRAVDPNIKLVGPELMTGSHLGVNDRKTDWLSPILRVAGPQMDAVSWHYYPLDSGQTDPMSSAYPSVDHLLFQTDASDWPPASIEFADTAFPHLKEQRDQYAPGAELWVTEIAPDSGNGGEQMGTQTGALWAADALGRFAGHGVDTLIRFIFKSTQSHKFALIGPEFNVKPSYGTYWLYANHWGNKVVDAQSDNATHVNAHAALADDGSLSIVLVNKLPENRTARITLEDWTPANAERWTLTADAYDATEATINGEPLTLEGLHRVEGEPVDASSDGLLELPPLSVTVLKLHPG